MAQGLADGRELRYVGTRFNGGALPFDVLPDLSAFRDLLTAIAKTLWLHENPDRQRLPRGFNQSIAFDLVGISDGSAVPKVRWDRVRAHANAPELVSTLDDLLDRSFTETAKLFQQAGQDKLPSVLPADQVAALNRFGSSLQGNERIEFIGTEDENSKVIFLDASRRRKIVTKVRETYTSNFVGSGTLITSSSKGFITVSSRDLGELSFYDLTPAIVEAHYDGNLGSEVQFEIEVELDSNDQFRKVTRLIDLSIVNGSDSPKFIQAMKRINTLRGRGSGWLDGFGEAMSHAAVKAARAFLDQRPTVTETASICATPDGGLNVEFVHGKWDYSLEFLPSGQVDFYGVELDGDDTLEPLTYNSVDDALVAFDHRFKMMDDQ